MRVDGYKTDYFISVYSHPNRSCTVGWAVPRMAGRVF